MRANQTNTGYTNPAIGDFTAFSIDPLPGGRNTDAVR